MMDVDSRAVSDDDAHAKLVEALTFLHQVATTRGVQSFVLLVSAPDERGELEERLFSVFDLVEDEGTLDVLERWCEEARKAIALYKSNPGGSS